MKFEPVIKWSGSKRSQSEYIVDKIIETIGNSGEIYYEPFCGGCSILMQLLLNKDKISFKKYICSDYNKDLINLWNKIKDEPKEIIDNYYNLWNKLNYDDDIQRKKHYFNEVRDRFNKYRNPSDFMFIMRTTTNGMPRYNRAGEFNNSFHVTRNGIMPSKLEKIIYQWSKLLNDNNVEFIHSDYVKILPLNKNDFIYLDPPYANTKGMYYGSINLDILWNYLSNLKCRYIMSFDGKVNSEDLTYEVPKSLYNIHEYVYSGNSSFRRVIGKSNSEYVSESLYIKNREEL